MARTNQRKLWIVEVWENKRWQQTNFDGFPDDRESMLNALASARHQYPDEKYKLTTYVPAEPARAKKKKTKRRGR